MTVITDINLCLIGPSANLTWKTPSASCHLTRAQLSLALRMATWTKSVTLKRMISGIRVYCEYSLRRYQYKINVSRCHCVESVAGFAKSYKFTKSNWENAYFIHILSILRKLVCFFVVHESWPMRCAEKLFMFVALLACEPNIMPWQLNFWLLSPASPCFSSCSDWLIRCRILQITALRKCRSHLIRTLALMHTRLCYTQQGALVISHILVV